MENTVSLATSGWLTLLALSGHCSTTLKFKSAAKATDFAGKQELHSIRDALA